MILIAERWTPDRLRTAQAILGRHFRVDDALPDIANALGFDVSRHMLRRAFVGMGLGDPSDHLRQRIGGGGPIPPVAERDTERLQAVEPHELPDDTWTTAPASQPPVVIVNDESEAPHERFAALVDLVKKQTRKGGISLEQLCDDLGMSPKAARAYLEDAREVGITIEVAHEKLLFRAPDPSPSAPPVSVAPGAAGREHRIAVFSDLHFGSLYCLKMQFTSFVNEAYESGIRDFFCPGDIIEGCYRHAQFERSSESLEDQQTEFLDALPHLPGMRVFFIDGNHDFTFTEKTGVESGRNLVRMARERGRDDLHFFGSRGALVRYGDTTIELWHPKKGAAYALSYQQQQKIRATAPERLPHILLTGHTHQAVKFRCQNVWAFYAGTFQHGDGPYGRSIGGDVATGGTIIDWRIDEDGVVRELGDRFKLAHHEARRFDVAV